MCGRYTLWADEEEIIARFGVAHSLAMRAPSWNIAPGSMVTVVTERLDAAAGEEPSKAPTLGGSTVREVDVMRWGLLPHWSREGTRPHINARAETVTEKPSFRSAARRRRCLVPANGHYEWEKGPAPAAAGVSGSGGAPRGRTVPWFFRAPSGALLAYAGIFEERVDTRTGEVDRGVAILTRPAPDEHGCIHDRCPLVVPEELRDAWLDPGCTDPHEVRSLIDAVPPPHFVTQEVDPRVGSIRHDGPWLLGTGADARSAGAGHAGGIDESAPVLFDL